MRIRDWSSYVCSSDLLFAKSCYVGYTATPFANIFINPDAYGDDVREELFPRDFIYCLDAPTTYFGAEKVFLDEATSQSIVRPIDDCENLIPYAHKRDDPVPELPPSLYRALEIGRASWRERVCPDVWISVGAGHLKKKK